MGMLSRNVWACLKVQNNRNHEHQTSQDYKMYYPGTTSQASNSSPGGSWIHNTVRAPTGLPRFP